MQYNGLDPDKATIDDIAGLLEKRGITDSQQNPLVHVLLSVMEPPGCHMTHCEHYGNQDNFANCAKNRGKTEGFHLPGRCKILREYKQRGEERQRIDERVGKAYAILHWYFPLLDWDQLKSDADKIKAFAWVYDAYDKQTDEIETAKLVEKAKKLMHEKIRSVAKKDKPVDELMTHHIQQIKTYYGRDDTLTLQRLISRKVRQQLRVANQNAGDEAA